MAKNRYIKPVLLDDIDPDDPIIIDFGNSVGTSGQDNIFDFEDEDLEALIGAFDYLDLEEMDADFDGFITWDEYNDWASNH